MSGRGARSYPLVRGTHGPVYIGTPGCFIRVTYRGRPVLNLNAFIGKLEIIPYRTSRADTLQCARVVDRFFNLVEATRYYADVRGNRVYIVDRAKNQSTLIPEAGLTIGLPVKCVMRALKAHTDWNVNQGASYLANHYEEFLEDAETVL